MKVGVVQIRPLRGDVPGNIQRHKTLLDSAIAHGADVVIFPELSLTGYEPMLARDLAVEGSDRSLDIFQSISDTHDVVIGVGMPTQQESGICISLILFQPNQHRLIYSKKHLHADELPFFIRGENVPIVHINGLKVAFAICYELSVPEHAEEAHRNNADVYIASVAKSEKGVANASERLAAIARNYSMPVLMSNCVGQTDDFVSAGQTAAWNRHGENLDCLNNETEGFLLMETNTQLLMKMTVSNVSSIA